MRKHRESSPKGALWPFSPSHATRFWTFSAAFRSGNGRSVVQMDQVKQVEVSGDEVWVTLGLTTWAMPIWEQARTECEELLTARLPGVKKVTVEIVEHARPAEKLGQIGLEVKSVIAVGSGQGRSRQEYIASDCLWRPSPMPVAKSA